MSRIALSRRTILVVTLFVSALTVAAEHSADVFRRPALTPECDDDMTPEQSEGRYDKPSAPLKDDFMADAPEGRPLLLGKPYPIPPASLYPAA